MPFKVLTIRFHQLLAEITVKVSFMITFPKNIYTLAYDCFITVCTNTGFLDVVMRFTVCFSKVFEESLIRFEDYMAILLNLPLINNRYIYFLQCTQNSLDAIYHSHQVNNHSTKAYHIPNKDWQIVSRNPLYNMLFHCTPCILHCYPIN